MDDKLSPAMRRWEKRMAEGYSIRPVIARSNFRGTVWQPGLFNPEGHYVQRVRMDTFRKLVRLGIIHPPEGKG